MKLIALILVWKPLVRLKINAHKKLTKTWTASKLKNASLTNNFSEMSPFYTVKRINISWLSSREDKALLVFLYSKYERWSKFQSLLCEQFGVMLDV